MALYFVFTGRGVCLREGTDEDTVREAVLREVGTLDGVQDVRQATKADAVHIRAMGGRVPASAYEKWDLL